MNDIRNSRFLSKEDVGIGTLLTIKSVQKENVAMKDDVPDHKVTISFVEDGFKPMVVNTTNGTIIAQIVGDGENIEATWPGTKIVAYNDPNVGFGGKITGGIRVRAPKPGSVPTAKPVDDLPF
jgi:hypothetical protein